MRIALPTALRPVTPIQEKQQPVSQKATTGSPARLPILEQDVVQFGRWYSARIIALPPKAAYVSGFTPGKSLKQLFPDLSDTRRVRVLDSQTEFRRVCAQAGLPPRALFNVDWRNEVVVLVALPRSKNVDVTPQALYYNGYREILEVHVPKEKRSGRDAGVAWYLGKVSNTRDSEHNRHSYEWELLSRKTRVSVREVD